MDIDMAAACSCHLPPAACYLPFAPHAPGYCCVTRDTAPFDDWRHRTTHSGSSLEGCMMKCKFARATSNDDKSQLLLSPLFGGSCSSYMCHIRPYLVIHVHACVCICEAVSLYVICERPVYLHIRKMRHIRNT
jgi:hypothetical protein